MFFKTINQHIVFTFSVSCMISLHNVRKLLKVVTSSFGPFLDFALHLAQQLIHWHVFVNTVAELAKNLRIYISCFGCLFQQIFNLFKPIEQVCLLSKSFERQVHFVTFEDDQEHWEIDGAEFSQGFLLQQLSKQHHELFLGEKTSVLHGIHEVYDLDWRETLDDTILLECLLNNIPYIF